MIPGRYATFVLISMGFLLLLVAGCRTWTGVEQKAAESYNWGNMLRDSGSYDEAVEAYRRALELQPNMVPPAFNLALTLAELERYPEAVEIFEMLRNRDKANLEILRALAWTHLQSGNGDEAIRFYSEALAVFEADQISLRAIAEIHEAAARPSDAVEYRRALLRLNDTLDNQWDLARTLVATGRHSESLDEYRMLVLRSTGDSDLLSEAGDAAFQNNFFVEAIGYYERLIELETEDAGAWMKLARIRLIEFQEYRRGLEALSTALEKGFEDDDDLEALIADSPPEIEPAVRELIIGRESP